MTYSKIGKRLGVDRWTVGRAVRWLVCVRRVEWRFLRGKQPTWILSKKLLELPDPPDDSARSEVSRC